MKPLVFIKLGGSLITNKDKLQTPRPSVIRRLAVEIFRASRQCKEHIVVTHGSGSYAHPIAARYDFTKGISHKKNRFGAARIHYVCSLLNNIVVNGFLSQGSAAVTVAPSSAMITDSRKIKSLFLEPLLVVLKNKLIPILYGDAIWDSKLGCVDSSTESVIEAYTRTLRKKGIYVNRVVYCGITDGVYDEKKKTILRISPTSYKTLPDFVKGSASIDTTGGMRHKLEVALRMSCWGVSSHIVNGNRNKELFNTLMSGRHHGTVVATT